MNDDQYTVADLLREVAELLRERAPLLAPADQARLHTVLPRVEAALQRLRAAGA